MKQWLVSISLIFLISTELTGQKNVINQDFYWVKLTIDYQIDQKWNASYYIEDRNFFEASRSHHFLNSLAINRKLKKNWKFGVGYLYFLLTLPQDPDSNISFTRPEHRPFLSLSNQLALTDRLNFGIRYMAEWRLRKNTNEARTGTAEGFSTETRFRFKSSLTYAMAPRWQLMTSIEPMIHFGEGIVQNTFDQNRISLALTWAPIQLTKLTFGYLHWYQQRPSGIEFYQRDIWMMSLALKITKKDVK